MNDPARVSPVVDREPASASGHGGSNSDPGSRHEEIAAELALVIARQRETLGATATAAATLAAIRASNIHRLTRTYRRFVPAVRPPVPDLPPSRPQGAAAASAAGDPLERLLARERETLARLETESRRVHHELNVAAASRPRRALMALNRGLGRAMRLARHPWWTFGAVVRALGNRGTIGGCRVAWQRFRWNAAPLRFEAPVAQQTDQPTPGDALRWLPPVTISGETFNALFSHPHSSITYRIQVGTRPARRSSDGDQPSGGGDSGLSLPAKARPNEGASGGGSGTGSTRPRTRVVARCGLHPRVWPHNHGGAEFELDVQIPDRSWSARRSLVMNPGDRFVDRRWRRLAIALPSGAHSEVIVRLTTRLAPGASGAHAWSLWGEPRLESLKSLRAMWRSVLGLVARIRYAGLVGTFRQIRDLQATDRHAALYRRWIELNTPTAEAHARMVEAVPSLGYKPRISVLTPVYNTDPRWLRACIESVRGQVYPDWELCLADDGSTARETLRVLQQYQGDSRIKLVRLTGNSGISVATNAALQAATGEFVALLDHDDELAPEALFEVVRLLNQHQDADFIYSDEDKLDAAAQRCDPYFKPDWSPEHFRSCMYTCHLMVLRASLVAELGGFRRGVEGSQDYDLVLRVIERSARIHHLPLILYHWRKVSGSMAASGLAKKWAVDAGERALSDHLVRSGTDAVVVRGPAPGLYRVRYRIAGKPLVSIVIPTDGRSREAGGRIVNLLTNCVRSIVEKSTYGHYEIIVADNGQLPPATIAYLEGVSHRRVHFEGPFNYARKLNFAVRHSRGEHLLLFNDDIEVITPDWIEAMLEYSQQPAIGAVGAKLLYPDGRLQHIGVVMGVCGMAAHAFHSHPGSSAGYGSSALIVRNYSAVTAACMMTRRELYEQLNGFDERFVFDFNDTDYCLRLRREGLRLVFTPHAELYHLEGATFGARTWNADDLDAMRRAWSEVCERDPYYNPHLTRDFPDYRVRT